MRWSRRLTVVALIAGLTVSGCGSEELVDVPEETAASAESETPTPTTTPTPAPTPTPTPTTELETIESTTSTVAPSPTMSPRPPLIDGHPAPDLTLDLDNGTVCNLMERYEPVVLFFWATWCHNCHEMMPMVDELAADYEEHATVVAVARLSELSDVESDVIEYLPSGATRWVSDEDNAISEAFGVPGNPVSILVVGGIEADRWLGSTPVTDISNLLDEVLGLYE
mgnify:CR=1 FL=1